MRPAIPIATGANSRPIIATIAPIAAGGNNLSIQPIPMYRTKIDKITKDKPNITKAPLAASYPRPAVSTAPTGAIKAKLEPK